MKSQIEPLLIRNLKNFVRNPLNQVGRIMQLILFPFLISKNFIKPRHNILGFNG
jgi:hypothetical protein